MGILRFVLWSAGPVRPACKPTCIQVYTWLKISIKKNAGRSRGRLGNKCAPLQTFLGLSLNFLMRTVINYADIVRVPTSWMQMAHHGSPLKHRLRSEHTNRTSHVLLSSMAVVARAASVPFICSGRGAVGSRSRSTRACAVWGMSNSGSPWLSFAKAREVAPTFVILFCSGEKVETLRHSQRVLRSPGTPPGWVLVQCWYSCLWPLHTTTGSFLRLSNRWRQSS